MGNGIECELEGVANGFATPSLKLRRPRALGLKAVPNHRFHYIQTAISMIIIFHPLFLNSPLLFSKNWVLNTKGYDTKISVYNGNGSENCIKCELEGVANDFATPSLKL